MSKKYFHLLLCHNCSISTFLHIMSCCNVCANLHINTVSKSYNLSLKLFSFLRPWSVSKSINVHFNPESKHMIQMHILISLKLFLLALH